MRERQPCVYMLASGYNGTLYVGMTSDLGARVAQHRTGAHDGFTKRHDVKQLVWYELTDQMTDAIASEKRIKKWPRDWKRNLIERDNPEWNDLAAALGFDPLR
ncbi:MAG TPA: GIY-YIG nuclease family protein [Sphingomonas sp.]|uniref:GIY-YIG nuclease family protein n=1 Tax=Sphingomonas sp. TaxID=28214 RepID=UPI002BA069F8|nr:GIY-YIG nuclease family protein [Sphingomonas sp.]HMI19761.1 GIY-YIG nuclease family protein [Sphingomonas sp.]